MNIRIMDKMLAIVMCCFWFSFVDLLPLNDTSYSKVAKWGSISIPNEGRSSGQSLYTQRSDVKISNVQSSPVYYPTHSRVAIDKSNKLPGKGEVIFQDRFNPPTYFQFMDNDDKKTVVYPSQSKPPGGLYDSPISSYSPMPSGIPKDAKPAAPGPAYPPNVDTYVPVYTPPKKQMNTYVPPTKSNDNSGDDGGYVYNPPPKKLQSKPPSFMGPYAPPPSGNGEVDAPPSDSSEDSGDDNDSSQPIIVDEHDHHHPNDENDSPPTGDSDDHPPSGADIDYSDFQPHHHHHHHSPKLPIDNINLNFEKPKAAKPPKPEYDRPPPEFDHPMSAPSGPNGKEPDLFPPPTGPSQDFSKQVPDYLDHDPTGKFPYDVPYLYNDDHHHHHVYHEIEHTTTTEAPNDERVNKGHYSYYYLGRKLWYVPLYFSVYFIIYITILILKSIARHKVNFVHDLDAVKSRSSAQERSDHQAATVQSSIDNFRRRYIAM